MYQAHVKTDVSKYCFPFQKALGPKHPDMINCMNSSCSLFPSVTRALARYCLGAFLLPAQKQELFSFHLSFSLATGLAFTTEVSGYGMTECLKTFAGLACSFVPMLFLGDQHVQPACGFRLEIVVLSCYIQNI